ncbi:hypothetical protein [uncultured Bacteroides sp.]|uniref:hypothetical protein n=1 Tax=uncultured Bacteroides sp. TaxID=162156 RepID=UPI0025CE87BB|nr:hypothetical protein [uncultured Bacteroides sp.]
MRKFFMLLFTVTTGVLQAQNLVIRDQFSADSTAKVFNGKVYLYPSHDIPSPVGQHLHRSETAMLRKSIIRC